MKLEVSDSVVGLVTTAACRRPKTLRRPARKICTTWVLGLTLFGGACTSGVVSGVKTPSGLTTIVNATAESPGGNCAAGGERFDFGLDTNANKILDPGEITNTVYVCN